jgi:signal transduction histidine kinase
LSIAQAIAQAHGSEIAVESAPGAGARFRLTLKT